MKKVNATSNNHVQPSSYDNCSNFHAAMQTKGLMPPYLIPADGKIHRFRVEGDRSGTKNGWAWHSDTYGSFGSWKTGESFNWRADVSSPLTTWERLEIKAKRQKQKEEADKRELSAFINCLLLLQDCEPASPDNPYLISKGIRPHGILQHGSNLVIPLRDSSNMNHSVQFIGPGGKKRFMPGGRTKGCFHYIEGIPDGPVYIAEGYATAATLHERTGAPVVVAFSAGNLVPVAKAVRKMLPSRAIVIAADNDHLTPGNPGLTKGRSAAQLIEAGIVYPSFPEGHKGTDFNDLARMHEVEK